MKQHKKSQLTAAGFALLFGFAILSGGCASTSHSDETMALVQRAEQAASRAEAAASRAEAASARADSSAEKAERIFNMKMKK